MTITPADMKALETRFMAATGTPGALLMEHAAQGVAVAIGRHVRKEATVLFLCGPGNNGGDGYAAARLWAAQGGRAIICEMTDEPRGDAALMRSLALTTPGVSIRIFQDGDALPWCEAIVDALFGTGLSHSVEGTAAEMIHQANEANVPIIAVDIPSGLDGLSGRLRGGLWNNVICAAETVTFHRIKPGLLLGAGPDYAGKITVQPILIPRGSDLDLEFEGMLLTEPAWLANGIFSRNPLSHKGDYGRVVLLCGSRGMAGAAALCANAAMRTGAGLTNILCRESLLPILQTLAPAATCTVLPEKDGMLLPEAAAIVSHALDWADAACIGCGLGQSPDVMPLLRLFAAASCPVVWDADALNLLARHDGILPLKEADVITPHIGEAARLLDADPEELEENSPAALESLHELCGCTVLLKGTSTLITDGMSTWCSRWGSPAMAKGGSGDVLSGILTALLARPMPDSAEGRLSSAEASAYAALIHGLAGIRAAKVRGENCVLPTDIIEHIRLDAEGIG